MVEPLAHEFEDLEEGDLSVAVNVELMEDALGEVEDRDALLCLALRQRRLLPCARRRVCLLLLQRIGELSERNLARAILVVLVKDLLQILDLALRVLRARRLRLLRIRRGLGRPLLFPLRNVRLALRSSLCLLRLLLFLHLLLGTLFRIPRSSQLRFLLLDLLVLRPASESEGASEKHRIATINLFVPSAASAGKGSAPPRTCAPPPLPRRLPLAWLQRPPSLLSGRDDPVSAKPGRGSP